MEVKRREKERTRRKERRNDLEVKVRRINKGRRRKEE